MVHTQLGRSVVSLQILIKPLDGTPDRVHLVLPLFKAVAFICVVVRIHSLSVFLQQLHDLLRLLLGNTWIIVPLQNQKWCLHVMDIRDG